MCFILIRFWGGIFFFIDSSLSTGFVLCVCFACRFILTLTSSFNPHVSGPIQFLLFSTLSFHTIPTSVGSLVFQLFTFNCYSPLTVQSNWTLWEFAAHSFGTNWWHRGKSNHLERPVMKLASCSFCLSGLQCIQATTNPLEKLHAFRFAFSWLKMEKMKNEKWKKWKRR